jgi:GxxExxY protein
MNTVEEQIRINGITKVAIGCAYKVSLGLGTGFLEKVYENALRLELERAGLKVEQQRQADVRYHEEIVGQYFADLLIEDRVMVELKVAKSIEKVYEAQCMNYLRATGLAICLLFNFGRPGLDVRRIVLGF